MAKKTPPKKPNGHVAKSLKNLRPKRITKKLRDSVRDTADSKKRAKTKRVDHKQARKEANNALGDAFSQSFTEYLKYLSSDNLIVNATTIQARTEILGRILQYHHDTETVIAFLADMWNLKVGTVNEYARKFFETYKNGLPYDRVMAARRAVKEYNDVIEQAIRTNDLGAAKNALVERNKLMGLVEADFWADELEGQDEAVQIYLPDNQREPRK